MADAVLCSRCRGTEVVQVGMGRGRRCRACGHTWIGTDLPAASPAVSQPMANRATSSTRAAAGRRNLETLKRLPMAGEVRAALRFYLDVALEGRRSGEGDEWTMRPLPSTKQRKHLRRLFCVNVSNMEVLVAHYDPTEGKESGGFIVLDGRHSPGELRRAIGRRQMIPAPYRTAESAVVVEFSKLDDLLKLLRQPPVQRAAASLNAWLRVHAQVPSLQRQWHVTDFCSWVLQT